MGCPPSGTAKILKQLGSVAKLSESTHVGPHSRLWNRPLSAGSEHQSEGSRETYAIYRSLTRVIFRGDRRRVAQVPLWKAIKSSTAFLESATGLCFA